jgi:hypothetical protein
MKWHGTYASDWELGRKSRFSTGKWSASIKRENEGKLGKREAKKGKRLGPFHSIQSTKPKVGKENEKERAFGSIEKYWGICSQWQLRQIYLSKSVKRLGGDNDGKNEAGGRRGYWEWIEEPFGG